MSARVDDARDEAISSRWRGGAWQLGGALAPLLPPALAYRMCDAAGALGPALPAWPAIGRNLQAAAPTRTPAERARAGRQIVSHLFANYYDLLRSDRLSAAALAALFRIEGLANGQRALAAGRGVVVVTLHTGSFSLAFEPVARALGAELLVVVEQLRDRAAHAVVNRLRARSGVEVVAVDRTVTRRILRALGRGAAVVLAQDRLIGTGSVTVPFFGRPTALPSGAATLALRTGAPLVPAYVSRLPDGRGRIVIDPPLLLPDGPDAVQRTTAALARVLEGYIRADPSQWLLTNDVWSSEERANTEYQ